MASYNARRGANLTSQFVRDQLNTVHDPQEDFSSLEPENNFDMFVNAKFFDFDTGAQTDFKPDDAPAPTKPAAVEPAATTTSMIGDFGMDFISPSATTAGDLNFDFNDSYASPINGNFPGGIGFQPLQPNPQTAYPPVPHAHPQHPAYSQHHAAGQTTKGAGDRRRSVEPHASNRAMSIEEASRIAAEEDKRRRNTAASARFRVKKKQREQALEKNAKEMNDKMAQLEAKITQLETENSWLKKLILEKNNVSSSTKDDVSKLSDDGTKDEIKVETGNKSSAEAKDKADS